MDFNKFVEWAFYGVVGGSFVYGVSILSHLKQSIDDLNKNVSILVEKSSWHEKMIDKLETKITELERKMRDAV